jgi:hypothetical protein
MTTDIQHEIDKMLLLKMLCLSVRADCISFGNFSGKDPRMCMKFGLLTVVSGLTNNAMRFNVNPLRRTDINNMLNIDISYIDSAIDVEFKHDKRSWSYFHQMFSNIVDQLEEASQHCDIFVEEQRVIAVNRTIECNNRKLIWPKGVSLEELMIKHDLEEDVNS